MENTENNEILPVSPSIKVVDFRTTSKGAGWWSAVVLQESYGRRQISLYLWQRKKGQWKRKQKFTIQTAKKWEKVDSAMKELIPGLLK
ncbi:MAG: hypothetical protein PHI86_00070 [Candidatus Omnitrophica bacterium]|nr:hypothetical protein [Candidatus Omnitrophota bacterium]